MRNILVWLLLFIGTGCFVACNNNGAKKKYLIPEDKLVDLLVEMHIADAVYSEMKYQDDRIRVMDSTKFYGLIFSKFDVTRQQFDSTMKYYSHQKKDLDPLYDQVITRLSMMESNIMKRDNLEMKPQSLNLWPGKDTIHIKDSISRAPFEIPIKNAGEYTIYTKVRLYEKDESINPTLTAWFEYTDSITGKKISDTLPRTSYKKDNWEYIYKTSDSIAYHDSAHLRGYLIDFENSDTLWNQHAEINQIFIEYSRL